MSDSRFMQFQFYDSTIKSELMPALNGVYLENFNSTIVRLKESNKKHLQARGDNISILR